MGLLESINGPLQDLWLTSSCLYTYLRTLYRMQSAMPQSSPKTPSRSRPSCLYTALRTLYRMQCNASTEHSIECSLQCLSQIPLSSVLGSIPQGLHKRFHKSKNLQNL